MKKYLSLIALVLAVTSAHANFWTNCTNNGGTIIQANSYGNDKGGLCNDPNNPNLTNNCNGKRFCKGQVSVNWWTAFTWCESIGGKLASFEHVCPGNQVGVGGICPNIKEISDNGGLLGSSWKNNTYVQVWFSSGKIETLNRNDSKFNRHALCEE